MFIDTHCHLSHDDYDDIDLVIKENIESGVSNIVISACTLDTLDEAISIASLYDCIYVTLGFHPSEASFIGDRELDVLREKLKFSKVVGLGEIGLDYHYGKDNRDKQISLFRKQLDIADEFGLPVVIHSRDATFDTINILKEYHLSGVIHCFSGSLETARTYISMGYQLGIGGVVTFSNSNLGSVVREIGLDHIVLETDSPYLAPVPYRGKQNSSKYIPLIADKVSEICGVSVEEVADITTNNARHLFDLDSYL